MGFESRMGLSWGLVGGVRGRGGTASNNNRYLQWWYCNLVFHSTVAWRILSCKNHNPYASEPLRVIMPWIYYIELQTSTVHCQHPISRCVIPYHMPCTVQQLPQYIITEGRKQNSSCCFYTRFHGLLKIVTMSGQCVIRHVNVRSWRHMSRGQCVLVKV